MNQLTEFQIKKLSSFLFTLSQISIGSVLLKFFEPGLEVKLEMKILIPVSFGILLAVSCFWIGLYFAAHVKT